MAHSRFNRLPFSPSYLFEATRQITLNGRDYAAGAEIETAGISIHRLRQMYDGRKIAVSLDADGNPRTRVAEAPLQDGEVLATLVGVQNDDGSITERAALPGDILQDIASDMQIEGAEQMGREQLVDAIATEPVIIDEAPVEIPVKAPRYHAEHRGAGRWYVVDSTTTEPVSEPLKKDEALAKAAELNG